MARQRIKHRGIDLTIQSDGSVTLGDDGPKIGQVKRGGGSSVHYWYAPDVPRPARPGAKSEAAGSVFDDWIIQRLSEGFGTENVVKKVVERQLGKQAGMAE